MELLHHLANIRTDEAIEEAVAYFNTAKIRETEVVKTALTITPYRRVADGINAARLETLQTPARTYACTVSGQFDDKAETPAPRMLTLKVGALIIFNRNISAMRSPFTKPGQNAGQGDIDIDRGTFAHRQLYVALSRTRAKADIHILKRVDESDVILDKRVIGFLS